MMCCDADRLAEREHEMNVFEKYQHQRNYRCRIKEYLFKGLRMITMENSIIKVSILVDKGTDIFEFVYKPKDIDFLWHSFNGVRNPAGYVPSKNQQDGDFLDFYEGGWQELFPNIGNSCVYKGAPLGVHGEVCMAQWEYRIEVDTPEEIAVRFWIRTPRSPYYLEKTLRISEGDAILHIDERVINEGDTDMEFMWGHHPAFGPMFLDESCTIEFPEGIKAKTVNQDLGRYGPLPANTDFNWPLINDCTGKQWNLSKVPSIDDKLFFMFHIFDLPVGQYAVKNNELKVGFQMNWDKNRFPYIWVWAPYGGAENYPWYGRNYNLAIEPWSAIPDNLPEVIKAGMGIKIKPWQEIRTKLEAKAFEFV